MFLEEVEDRARDVRLAVAAASGHERVLALDDDAVAGAALVGVERRRVARVLARLEPLRERAARRRRLRGLVVVRAVLGEARGRRRGAFFFFFLSVNMGWSPSSSSSTLVFCSTLGFLGFLLRLGLDGHGRAARLRLRHRALRRTRLCDGERSRRLGLHGGSALTTRGGPRPRSPLSSASSSLSSASTSTTSGRGFFGGAMITTSSSSRRSMTSCERFFWRRRRRRGVDGDLGHVYASFLSHWRGSCALAL